MSHDAGRVCQCVADHRPKAMELSRHRILPGYLGGTYNESNVIWICSNTHVATHELLRLYLKADGPPAGDVLNDYPGMARRLAAEGFRRYKEARA